ncbi:unnamed protein product [Prunus armeniaca]|uniref:Uncharacterized protein n=1 Tax=Prunus armeniaca TaxID=36596 RepID=A0A6J5X4S4_PRUAR|nr:unnamed protein product [Prunus armeniaca]
MQQSTPQGSQILMSYINFDPITSPTPVLNNHDAGKTEEEAYNSLICDFMADLPIVSKQMPVVLPTH